MLFDLEADPGERLDFARERPDRVAALRAELERQVAARPEPDALLPADLGDDVKQRLEALGCAE